MKISGINVSHLRNDAHFQFHTEFRNIMSSENPETIKIKDLFDAHLPLLLREDEALKKINKSALTQKIREADKARDDMYKLLYDFNKLMCRHFSPSTAEAARRIQIVLDTYGNISIKPQNEQTSAIYNLTQELDLNKYDDDRINVYVNPYIGELKRLNQNFEALMRARFNETASKTDIVLREARIEIDVVYRSVEERINALIIVEGVQKYESFVRRLNAVIAKFVIRKYNRHNGASSDDEQTEE